MPDSDLTSQKKIIRAELLAIRKAMTPEEVAANSKAILENILSVRLINKYSVFHCYYPINNEVDTVPLLTLLFDLQKTVVMPRTDFRTGELINYKVESFSDLEETRFGMKEPRADFRLFTDPIDVVFVPGVAFDRQLYRMGYGKGFYDRFLKKAEAFNIGLGYNFQIRNNIPHDELDIRMNFIITETQINDSESIFKKTK